MQSWRARMCLNQSTLMLNGVTLLGGRVTNGAADGGQCVTHRWLVSGRPDSQSQPLVLSLCSLYVILKHTLPFRRDAQRHLQLSVIASAKREAKRSRRRSCRRAFVSAGRGPAVKQGREKMIYEKKHYGGYNDCQADGQETGTGTSALCDG